ILPEEEVEEEAAEEEAEEEADDVEAEDEAAEEGDDGEEGAEQPEGEEENAEEEEEGKEKEDKIDYGKRWAGSLRYEVTPLIGTDALERRPLPSPDGRTLLFIRERGDLWLRDLASPPGDERLIFE